LNKEGYILTNSAVVPPGATGIKVWVKGGKFFKAGFVHSVPESEISVIKIDPKGYNLQPIEFGDSTKVQIGEVAYTLGNTENSMADSDEPSFSAGIISGIYKLEETQVATASYKGRVFESTAAAMPRLEGGPLLNSEGKMIGLITLNYAPSRWLNNAIPIHYIEYDIKEALKKPAQPYQPTRVGEVPIDEVPTTTAVAEKGYLGIKVKQEKGKIIITEVDEDSPAAIKGLQKGDVIAEIAGEKITTAEEFNKKVNALTAGSILLLKIDLGGAGLLQDVRIELAKEKK
jgi:S1-C subfamily serine protease